MGILSGFFERPLVGLDIGVSGIKAVELSGQKTPRLIAYNRLPLPWDTIAVDGEVKRQDVLVAALRKLFDSGVFSTKEVAVGASGNSIITKKITMERMSAQELEHQLYWEAEQYIPFNINEVNLDFAILGESVRPSPSGGPQMDVLLVAAKRDYIENLTDIVREAGLTPSVVDSQVFALGNSFEFNYGHMLEDSEGDVASVIIDFGAGSTKMTVVEGDKTSFTRELRQSGIGCSTAISERLGVNLEQAERAKILEATDSAVATVVHDYLTGLSDEISRTIDFFLGQSHQANIGGIYICGGASLTGGLREVLEKKMPAPVAQLNPVQNIAGSGRRMNAQAIREIAFLGAVAIGLALRAAGDSR